jgi:hypothetical protein
MADYRNPNDPFYRDDQVGSSSNSAAWGWIAGALFLVVILAIALGHEPTMTASNDTTPPASTRMAPPANPINPAPFQPATPAPAGR